MKVRIFTLVAPPGNDLIIWVSLHGWQWTCLRFHVKMVIQYTDTDFYPFTVNNPIFTIIYEFYLQAKSDLSSENQFDWTFPRSQFLKDFNLRWDVSMLIRESLLCCAVTASQLYNVKCSVVMAWAQLGHGSLKFSEDSSQSSENLLTWLFANK